jgi:hypothetical protein
MFPEESTKQVQGWSTQHVIKYKKKSWQKENRFRGKTIAIKYIATYY